MLGPGDTKISDPCKVFVFEELELQEEKGTHADHPPNTTLSASTELNKSASVPGTRKLCDALAESQTMSQPGGEDV